MKRNGWLAVVLAAVCVLAEVADAQGPPPSPTMRTLPELLAAGSPWTSPSGMEFAWVPAGDFVMGSPEGQVNHNSDERQHGVRISRGFWMGKYEVTQGEWEAVMDSNPSSFKNCGARCPVERVSWEDVQEYIRKLNGLQSGSGNVYRLPTEAEWEYAARAGTGTTLLGYTATTEIAWCDSNSDGRTHPVGQKRGNAWGLHDMLGNVREWTADWYGDYPLGTVTDPRGPSTGKYRVRRGGGWLHHTGMISPARRGAGRPDGRYSSVGFRLVRTQ